MNKNKNNSNNNSSKSLAVGLWPLAVDKNKTFSVGHRVEEAPGGIRAESALDEGDVVGGLDADDGEQLHEEPTTRTFVRVKPASISEVDDLLVQLELS